MPGSVDNAAPTTVLPRLDGFRIMREREWSVRANEYLDGRAQVAKDFATSRKRLSCSCRLTASVLTAMREFYEARRGPLEPFIVYDMRERAEEGLTPLYDDTGVAAGAGKYTVRFLNSTWDQAIRVSRGEVTFAVVEVT